MLKKKLAYLMQCYNIRKRMQNNHPQNQSIMVSDILVFHSSSLSSSVLKSLSVYHDGRSVRRLDPDIFVHSMLPLGFRSNLCTTDGFSWTFLFIKSRNLTRKVMHTFGSHSFCNSAEN